jgi:hypothetical protein
VFAALARTCQPYKRRDRFSCCGSQLSLGVRADELVLSCWHCEDRLCEPCQEDKRKRLRDRVHIRCDEARGNVRFFTFTLRHSRTPLRAQIDRLKHSLRTLHRRPWWRAHQRGGIDCIEQKISDKDGLWHVHAHCLVEGDWIDQHELSRVWHEITGDSSVVDVEKKGTAEQMARYATKYATKPLHSSVYSDADKLDEACCALKGVRLVSCWGTWHGLDEDEDEPTEPITHHGTIKGLIGASLDGDAGARLSRQLPSPMDRRHLRHFCKPRSSRSEPLPTAPPYRPRGVRRRCLSSQVLGGGLLRSTAGSSALGRVFTQYRPPAEYRLRAGHRRAGGTSQTARLPCPAGS